MPVVRNIQPTNQQWAESHFALFRCASAEEGLWVSDRNAARALKRWCVFNWDVVRPKGTRLILLAV